jgi:hypothetical protein
VNSRGPFTRKDHFRDHLRDYHKEDIGGPKGERFLEEKAWLASQKAWVEERKIEASWWRCPKCLCRVQIVKYGYECYECDTPFDTDRTSRVEARRQAPDSVGNSRLDNYRHGTALAYPTNCSVCNDTALVWNMNGECDACPICQPTLEQSSSYKVDGGWNNDVSNGSSSRW